MMKTRIDKHFQVIGHVKPDFHAPCSESEHPYMLPCIWRIKRYKKEHGGIVGRLKNKKRVGGKDLRPGQKTDAEKAHRQREAAKVARAIWNSAEPAKPTHAYLRKRRLQPHGLKEHKGSLIVPVTDRGMIISLQHIHSSGSKRFMPNGRTKGGYYCIGSLSGSDTICVVERFSCGVLIHEATGYPAVVCFYAENLKHVINTIKEIYPIKRLVICPHEDRLMSDKQRKLERGLRTKICLGRPSMSFQ